MAAATMEDYAAAAATYYEKLETIRPFHFAPVTALWSFVALSAAMIVKIDGNAYERNDQASSGAVTIARSMRHAGVDYLARRDETMSNMEREQWAYRFGFLSASAIDLAYKCKRLADANLGDMADILWKSDARVLCDSEADCMRMAVLSDMSIRFLIWKRPAATYEVMDLDGVTAFRRSELVDA